MNIILEPSHLFSLRDTNSNSNRTTTIPDLVKLKTERGFNDTLNRLWPNIADTRNVFFLPCNSNTNHYTFDKIAFKPRFTMSSASTLW
jgi:hypothetical protein